MRISDCIRRVLFRSELALATLMLGHHDRSVIEADNALARRPGYVYGHVFKISALWMMGEHARAREASAALLQVRRSAEHTSELQSLIRISYAVFRLKKKTPTNSICAHKITIEQ